MKKIKEIASNDSLSFLVIIVVLFFYFDVSKLENIPNNITYLLGVLSLFLCTVFWLFYGKGTKWYMKFKTIVLFVIAVIISAIPLLGVLSFLFRAFIVYYDFGNEDIVEERCLITHVSSGKNTSLSYDFKGKTFRTKDYYYQDFKDCGYNKKECYVLVKFKQKPLGMLLELSVDKINN